MHGHVTAEVAKSNNSRVVCQTPVHLDGFYIMDTVNDAAVNIGDKYSPNSLNFNEQKASPVNLLRIYSQLHCPSPCSDTVDPGSAFP
ncbi:hypothetical protein STEG23_036024 [Scotinomys teguina]